MKEFWLYKVNVVNEVPNYIQYMTNLEKLQLTNCSIREIPSFLGQLKKLKLLNLRDNSIKTVDLSGGVFQELEVLVLKHNKIKSIKFDDVLLLLPKIKVLNLAENNLESVPPFIYTLNANTEMYFSRNPISNEEKERLESKFKTVIL
jgi:Leucine-rich repeat (LRR) protein